ncbi:hypothetical protein F5Y10DRAFT_29932 [Nemania abortiva]|nr:hypothetical protein F5Y10DRAFT_29932 [Nemania abortiva]
MATEQQQQQQQQQSAATVLSRPREPQPTSPMPGAPAASPGPSQTAEIRDYDFFAQRDLNEYRDASRAYFAEKNGNPSSWLGDATPPASAHPSLDEPRPAPGPLSCHSADSEPRSEKILGLRRKWFLTLVGVVGFVILVAVAVGVGVGTSRVANSSKSANASAPASDNRSSTITSVGTLSTSGIAVSTAASSYTSTSTGTSPASTSHASTTTSSSPEIPMSTASAPAQVPSAGPVATGGCTGVNNTEYTVPSTTIMFLQLCGLDYGEGDGAIDIRNAYTNTSADCMEMCAYTPECEGAGWGFIEGDHGPPFRCWMKSNVTSPPHQANTTWFFGLLVT